MIVYTTEKEFEESAIVFVARMAYEKAVEVISSGIVADESQDLLFYLKSLAEEKALSKDSVNAIATYLNMVLDENEEMLKYC